MRFNFLFLFLCWSVGAYAQKIVNLPVAGNTNQVRAVNLSQSGLVVLDKASDEISLYHIGT